MFPSIRATTAEQPNVLPPVAVDASAQAWPFEDASFDGVYNINMIHISPWAATLVRAALLRAVLALTLGSRQGLLREAGRLLKAGGFLLMYGPYKVGGEFTTESNREFDASLRGRNAEWGLRDVDDVRAEAARHGLQFVRRVDMPANNFCVIYTRAAREQ